MAKRKNTSAALLTVGGLALLGWALKGGIIGGGGKNQWELIALSIADQFALFRQQQGRLTFHVIGTSGYRNTVGKPSGMLDLQWGDRGDAEYHWVEVQFGEVPLAPGMPVEIRTYGIRPDQHIDWDLSMSFFELFGGFL